MGDSEDARFDPLTERKNNLDSSRPQGKLCTQQFFQST